MTVHYITADDYDRWNPGEPIEDVASDREYLHTLYREYAAQSSDWDRMEFGEWIQDMIKAEELYRITTDNEGRIIS